VYWDSDLGAGGYLLPAPVSLMWLSVSRWLGQRDLFVTFRFYGLLDPDSDKVWKPDDFRPID